MPLQYPPAGMRQAQTSGPQTLPQLLEYLRARKIMEAERMRKAGLEQRKMGLAEQLGRAEIGERGAHARYYGRMPRETTASEQIKQLQLKVLMSLPPEKRDEVIKAMLTKPVASIMFGKPASAGERIDIADARASLDHLNNLKKLFNKEFVGPIIGRVAPTTGLFGMTTESQEQFMAATTAFKNMIIKQITGAQMSESEADRIMKQVPDITDPPIRWKAKWEERRKNIETMKQRRLEILGQSGLKVPTGQQAPKSIEPYNLEGVMGKIQPQAPKAPPTVTAKPKAPTTESELREQVRQMGRTPQSKAYYDSWITRVERGK